MRIKSWALLPCGAFFAEGRVFYGMLALLMQLSLIFWPRAASWSRRFQDRSQVEKLLEQFSKTHRVEPDPYSIPPKKFRQAA